MTLALRHAIYYAIHNTEATATFIQQSPILAQPGNCSPSAYLDSRITAAWNTAAKVYNQSPTWLQGLAKDIPESKWFVKNVRNDPIRNARRDVMPGIGKCKKLPQDKKLSAKVPRKPAVDITTPVPCHSNPNIQLKVADWKSWAYTDSSCQ
eukprot:560384-Pelagomonas_calceolata.AAC.1